jgi:hypothetical protein
LSTEYSRHGANIFLGNSKDRHIPMSSLPVNIYTLNMDIEMGLFLTEREHFKIPKKIYGNTVKRANRFLQTFEARQGTTGILLTGLKGSGKTLEMTLTCEEALKRGYSVIVVPFAACGPAFNKFIQSINEPCIVIIDEFEKVYDDQEQEALLTLLDGTYPSKKLFMFTCNDKFKINTHMINRPGRIFYSISYGGLDEAFIRDYCADRLNDKSKTDSIVKVGILITDFNFDMLQALVEELNRYAEDSVKDCLELLNINMDYSSRVYYNIEYYRNGEKVEDTESDDFSISPSSVANPFLLDKLNVELWVAGKGKKKDRYTNLIFPLQGDKVVVAKDLSSIEVEEGEWKVIIKKPPPPTPATLSHFYGS